MIRVLGCLIIVGLGILLLFPQEESRYVGLKVQGGKVSPKIFLTPTTLVYSTISSRTTNSIPIPSFNSLFELKEYLDDIERQREYRAGRRIYRCESINCLNIPNQVDRNGVIIPRECVSSRQFCVQEIERIDLKQDQLAEYLFNLMKIDKPQADKILTSLIQNEEKSEIDFKYSTRYCEVINYLDCVNTEDFVSLDKEDPTGMCVAPENSCIVSLLN